MSLYAIGDLHLALSDKSKSMEAFGGRWENYIEKIAAGFDKLSDEDVCVICGDISWAMELDRAVEDFTFLNALPGKKVLIKGNHDFWWSTAAKINRILAENSFDKISFVFNNCVNYDGCAICGTRGWFYEEEKSPEHDRKILLREAGRLEASLKAAGDLEKLCFLHYPPRYSRTYVCDELIDVMNRYGVKQCWYGHLHGYSYQHAIQGETAGIDYRLVSADYLNFEPLLIKA
ncbi:MAG: metallophosphoesterase [Oscillospiraceae bacterium]|nr:metallophosphoesterase [Oscillospiraceae bacterium]